MELSYEMAVRNILLLMAINRRKGRTNSTLMRPREEAWFYSCGRLLRQETCSMLRILNYLSFSMSHFFKNLFHSFHTSVTFSFPQAHQPFACQPSLTIIWGNSNPISLGLKIWPFFLQWWPSVTNRKCRVLVAFWEMTSSSVATCLLSLRNTWLWRHGCKNRLSTSIPLLWAVSGAWLDLLEMIRECE